MEGGLEKTSPLTEGRAGTTQRCHPLRAKIGTFWALRPVVKYMARQPHLRTLLDVCFHLPTSERRHPPG